jgi:hypothetical protein
MAKTETVYSRQATEDVPALRAELKDAETQATAELKNDGKASAEAIQRVGSILKQIGDITGEQPGIGIT